jgi:RNA polymerase sigma-70 factor, ECF subfamily
MGMHVLEAHLAAPLDDLTNHETTIPRDPGTELGLASAVAVYVAQRPRLFKIAYRILGSVAEAEDVVQEVWVRWQCTDRTLVNNPPAFLATATSRLAINVLQAARTRHEAAVTPWLEDLADSAAHPGAGPEATAERTEAVDLALHLLMERLNPAERAAYLLRNGFDYPYRKIAAVLHLGAANARQLVSRAHRRLHSPRRQPVSSETHRRLVRAFVSAAQAGEFAELETLLAADIARHTRSRWAWPENLSKKPWTRVTMACRATNPSRLRVGSKT